VERPVLFLDEPTTGLDPRSRRAVWDEVRALREAGTTILLTTQYLDEADQLADRILIVDRGRVVAEGTPRDLKAKLGASVCEVRVLDPAVRAVAASALESLGVTVADDVLSLPAAGMATLPAVVRCLDAAGVHDAEINLRQPTLDEVFLALTGAPGGAPAAGADAPGRAEAVLA
jgi:ABC-2 type transport system ATP-binding protein